MISQTWFAYASPLQQLLINTVRLQADNIGHMAAAEYMQVLVHMPTWLCMRSAAQRSGKCG